MSKKVLFRTHHQYFLDHPAKKEIVKKIFAATGLLLLPFLATGKALFPAHKAQEKREGPC